MEAYFHRWSQNGSTNLKVENATWTLQISHVTGKTAKEEAYCIVWSYQSWFLGLSSHVSMLLLFSCSVVSDSLQPHDQFYHWSSWPNVLMTSGKTYWHTIATQYRLLIQTLSGWNLELPVRSRNISRWGVDWRQWNTERVAKEGSYKHLWWTGVRNTAVEAVDIFLKNLQSSFCISFILQIKKPM